MKNLTTIILLSFVFIGFVHGDHYNTYFVIQYLNESGNITVDGLLDEYTSYPFLRIKPNSPDHLTIGAIDDSLDCSAYIWLLCDTDNLYFAGRVTDDIIMNNMSGMNLWDGDAVLFYFGLYDQRVSGPPHTCYYTGDEPDYQIGISCTGLTYLWRWQIGETGTTIPGCQVSTIQNSDNWTFELKCPFSSFTEWATSELSPELYMILPFNILIDEDDDGSGRDAQLYWMDDASTEYSHERPDVWGRQVVIADTSSAFNEKPLITNVFSSSNIIYQGDIITLSASVFSEDGISNVICNLKTTGNYYLDTLELQFDNEDNYENTWVALPDLDQSTNILVDIIAVDNDGDTTQINNATSFQLYKPLILINEPYYNDSYKVFDDSNIAEIRLTIEQDSLDKIYAPGNEGNNNYIPANFSFTNDKIPLTTIPEVGVRLRGAIPRYCKKRDFKISFNEFVPGRNFYGLRKLNLRGLNRDPSIIREKICLDILHNMNVVSTRASYVNLYVNDEFYGLYLNVEEVNKNFLNAHFGNDNGNLYKCAREANLAIRPDGNYKFTFGPPPYAPHQIDRAYELSTNEDEDDYSDLIYLIEVINNTPDNNFADELEKTFNIHPLLKAQALSVMSGDWDGFWCNQNNYFLYHNAWTNKFEFIPRDLDLTLGVDWGGGEHAISDIYYYGPRNNDRPLINRAFNVSEYIGEYSMFVKQLIDTYYSTDTVWSKIDIIKEMIQTAAEEDNYRPLDYGWSISDFNNSYNYALGTFHAIDYAAPFDLVTRNAYGLKPFIETRDSAALSQLDMSHIPPMISNTSHFPLSPSETDQVAITTVVTSYTDIISVKLQYNAGSGFQSIEMYDDGMHDDSESGDQIYGTIIPSYPNIKRVFYFVSAQGTGVNDISVSPENAPYTSFYYTVGYEKPSLVINEFMADNESTITDEAGENDDWFELYNYGIETIQLGGMYLTDNLLNPTKWQIPDIQIAPSEFLLFWADEDQEQGTMHTNFKLSNNGEQIGLFDTDENANLPIDIYIFISQNDDKSYGRLPDGSGEWRILDNPTPGASNQATSTIIEQELIITDSVYPILYQNYPNPFNSSTVIHFYIPETSNVNLKIYNLLGKEKETILNSQFAGGDYEINYTPGDMPNGIYLLQLKTDNYLTIRKFILHK